MLIGAVLLGQAARDREFDWLLFLRNVVRAAVYFDSQTVLFFVVAGTLIAWRRAVKLGLLVAMLGVFASLMVIILSYVHASYVTHAAPMALELLGLNTNYMAALAVILLAVQRLRGRLDRWRIAACAGCGVHLALHVAFSAMPLSAYLGEWVLWARALFEVGFFGLMTFVAWCLAFYSQMTFHRPPVDAAHVVALQCPRCGTDQRISAGDGECSGCRLKIMIALDEGVCGMCGYALRGLTGDRCPECGTAFVPGAPTK